MMSTKTNYVRRALVLSVSAIALATAGCKHLDDHKRVAGWTLVDPKERHPILVSKEPTTLSVHVPSGASGLSPRQRAEVLQFATQYKAGDAGDGRVVISAPSGAANEVSAVRTVDDIRGILGREGFNPSDVVVEAYYDDYSPQPPVKLTYTRYVAQGPECGNFQQNLAYQPDNMAYSDFGCTTQRNFAAMVANPADLVSPRALTPRASERGTATFDKWVAGQQTHSTRSDDERIGNIGVGD